MSKLTDIVKNISIVTVFSLAGYIFGENLIHDQGYHEARKNRIENKLIEKQEREGLSFAYVMPPIKFTFGKRKGERIIPILQVKRGPERDKIQAISPQSIRALNEHPKQVQQFLKRGNYNVDEKDIYFKANFVKDSGKTIKYKLTPNKK